MSEPRIVHGDALQVLAGLEPDSVAAVVTDPPYATSGAATPKSHYLGSDNWLSRPRLADFGGNHRDQRSHGHWLTLVLTECLRVTGNGGSLLIFTDWAQLPVTSDAVQTAGRHGGTSPKSR